MVKRKLVLSFLLLAALLLPVSAASTANRRNLTAYIYVSTELVESRGDIGSSITFAYYVNDREINPEGELSTIYEGNSMRIRAVITEQDIEPDVGDESETMFISPVVMDGLKAGEPFERQFYVTVEEGNGRNAGSYHKYRVVFSITPNVLEPTVPEETESYWEAVMREAEEKRQADQSAPFIMLPLGVFNLLSVPILIKDRRHRYRPYVCGVVGASLSLLSIVMIAIIHGAKALIGTLLLLAAALFAIFGIRYLWRTRGR